MVYESNYSIFVYQYRDAANYKAHGVLMLFGQYDAVLEERIHKSCDSWNHFVAEQVGVQSGRTRIAQEIRGDLLLGQVERHHLP